MKENTQHTQKINEQMNNEQEIIREKDKDEILLLNEKIHKLKIEINQKEAGLVDKFSQKDQELSNLTLDKKNLISLNDQKDQEMKNQIKIFENEKHNFLTGREKGNIYIYIYI